MNDKSATADVIFIFQERLSIFEEYIDELPVDLAFKMILAVDYSNYDVLIRHYLKSTYSKIILHQIFGYSKLLDPA